MNSFQPISVFQRKKKIHRVQALLKKLDFSYSMSKQAQTERNGDIDQKISEIPRREFPMEAAKNASIVLARKVVTFVLKNSTDQEPCQSQQCKSIEYKVVFFFNQMKHWQTLEVGKTDETKKQDESFRQGDGDSVPLESLCIIKLCGPSKQNI